MAKVLVIGGAGYVGSATCALLLEQGHETWVLDDLSTGHSELILTPHFVRGKVGDRDLIRALLETENFDCVFHFAARNIVSESVIKRDEYFENNVTQTENLLDEMIRYHQSNPNFIPRFVFSSTCAIYGEGGGGAPLQEEIPYAPLNPYAETKLAVEDSLKNKCAQKGMKSVALRYFNASGAEPGLRVGEWHVPETHLIPRVFQQALSGEVVSVYGNDYPTPDGTAIRDYVHVTDLAHAHLAAMNRMLSAKNQNGSFEYYNLGSEKGYSVKEVIQEAEKVIGKKINIEFKPRRAGDAVKLVADSSKAKRELGFNPQITLHQILKTAWDWEQKRVKIKPRRAVFLDRDETLNPDSGYINDPDHLKIFDWAAPLIKKLKENGYDVFVVSNQSGIGRGLIKWHELYRVSLKLNSLLYAEAKVKLDDIASCPHHPDDGCECRKPKPGLLFELAKKFNLDLPRSFMIGDRDSDYQAGINAGLMASYKIGAGDREGLTRAIELILKT